MSTKFSIRPAPRKKPWICKRSPPCLKPDPIPKSLLCSYMVQIVTGPAAGQIHRGTFAVPYSGAAWTFIGADPAPGAAFWINWTYDPTTRTATAWSQYGTPLYASMGNWFEHPAGTPPNLRWISYALEDSTWEANGVCLLTA